MSKKKINKPSATRTPARPPVRALKLTRPLSTLPLRPLIGPAQGRLRPPVAAVAAAARLKASQTATAASTAATMQPPSKPKTAGAPKLKSVVSDAVRNAAAAIRSAYENQKPIPPIRDMLPPNDIAADRKSVV